MDPVHDGAIIAFRDFGNPQTHFLCLGAEPAGVMQLSSARRIKGAAVQDHANSIALRCDLYNLGVELQHRGIVVVEALCHAAILLAKRRERRSGKCEDGLLRTSSFALRLSPYSRFLRE